jgi:hypothetical protein
LFKTLGMVGTRIAVVHIRHSSVKSLIGIECAVLREPRGNSAHMLLDGEQVAGESTCGKTGPGRGFGPQPSPTIPMKAIP